VDATGDTYLATGGTIEKLNPTGSVVWAVHNDDTSMRVLSLDRDADIAPERTGVFTSGLVWIFRGRRIALFFTGCKHAGENLATVLRQRSADLPRPIQMCDALSRNEPNVPESLVPLLGNCNAHSRRNFVKLTSSFPEECWRG
jgi:transposase